MLKFLAVMNTMQSYVYIDGQLPGFLSDWAVQMGIELRPYFEQANYCLNFNRDQLQLQWFGEQNFLPISVQAPSQQRFDSNNLLLKAIGKKTRIVADLSAGLGTDAMTIASTGRKVYCIERCAPVALLLYDGIRRCQPTLSTLIDLQFNDSKSWLHDNVSNLDAIFIDTMFADKKKSAKSSKQMQILRELAGDDTDAQQLLACALNQDVSRVIVKKSANAIKSEHNIIAQYKGKAIRFDVYKPDK